MPGSLTKSPHLDALTPLVAGVLPESGVLEYTHHSPLQGILGQLMELMNLQIYYFLIHTETSKQVSFLFFFFSIVCLQDVLLCYENTHPAAKEICNISGIPVTDIKVKQTYF